MKSHPIIIRLFVSSPGDVVQERKLALDVIEHLLYEPAFKEKIAFNVVAWDKPGSSTPMLATMTPQAAINAGMPTPAECDIVIVIFWARMGTPLPEDYVKPDGTPYWSGTEWEYENAMEAARKTHRPAVIVYRRTEQIMLNPDDVEFNEKIQQYQRVKDFFAKFRDPKTGAILQGYNQYEKPDDFRREFETHLRVTVERLLKEADTETLAERKPVGSVREPEIWKGSPFPGLEAFTEKQAPIFFGRGREVDALIEKVSSRRFVAVVGASGSGKSSLVAAGLIPSLKSNTISTPKTASRDWFILRFTPGENPFQSLAESLINHLPELSGDAIEFVERVEKLTNSLQSKPDSLVMLLRHALRNVEDWVEVLLFVDQFEELFTITPQDLRESFTNLLIQPSDKLRVVVTLRSDFYHRAVEIQGLADKLREGSFPLALPDQFALLEMIEQPAKRAALSFEPNLARQIVQDTGNEPGALALMAYALDELYHAGKDKRLLTFDDYQVIEGVQGAIGKRAQTTFDSLDENTRESSIAIVFRELVEVDERGTATRQRAALSKFSAYPHTVAFVKAFVQARLLVASRSTGTASEATIEVAHEALLRSWPRLAQWIDETQDDLRLLRQVKNAAREWQDKGCSEVFLWKHERLQPVYEMRDRLGIEFDEIVAEFVKPEAERLLDEFIQLAQEKSMRTMMYRHMNIVDRFVEIGQPALQVMLKARRYASGATIDAIDKAIRNIGVLHLDDFIDQLITGGMTLKALQDFFHGDLPDHFSEVVVTRLHTLNPPLNSAILDVITKHQLSAALPYLKTQLHNPALESVLFKASIAALLRLQTRPMDDFVMQLLRDEDDQFRAKVIDTAKSANIFKLREYLLAFIADDSLDAEIAEKSLITLFEIDQEYTLKYFEKILHTREVTIQTARVMSVIEKLQVKATSKNLIMFILLNGIEIEMGQRAHQALLSMGLEQQAKSAKTLSYLHAGGAVEQKQAALQEILDKKIAGGYSTLKMVINRKNETMEIRQQALKTLIALDTKEAKTALSEILTERKELLDEPLLETFITEIGPESLIRNKSYANFLLSVERKTYSQEFQLKLDEIIQAVHAPLRPPSTIQGLIDKITRGEWNSVQDLVDLLLKEHPDEVLKALSDTLLTSKNSYRSNAARVMGLMRKPEAVPHLKKALLTRGEYSVVMEASILDALEMINTPEAHHVIQEWKNPKNR